MQHHSRCVASCAATLGLALALAVCGPALACETECSEEVARDSISEVMLEDTGMELEDTAPPPVAVDASVETQAAEVFAAEAPAPARAEPSR